MTNETHDDTIIILKKDQIIAEPFFGETLPLDVRDWPEIFVLMPIDDEFDEVYKDHIRKVANEFKLSCQTAGDFFSSKSIIAEIWSAIFHATLCIADCTGRNPNVFYEIGIAHTLGCPIILITQSMDDIPFDIRYIRAIEYKPTGRGLAKLESDLRKTIQHELAKFLTQQEALDPTLLNPQETQAPLNAPNRYTHHTMYCPRDSFFNSWCEVKIPKGLPEENVQILKKGIELSKRLMEPNSNFDQVRHEEEFREYSKETLLSSISAAFRSGAIRIKDAPLREGIGEELHKTFPIIGKAVVASIPKGIERILSTELISFVAATYVLPYLTTDPNVVGIGSGYTLVRMAERSVIGISNLNHAVWVPLISYPKENMVLHSANYVALVMANKQGVEQGKEKCLTLPPAHGDILAIEEIAFEEVNKIEKVVGMWQRTKIAFITVGTLEQRSSDGRDFPLSGVAKAIIDAGREEEIAGELLGLYLTEDAEMLDDEELVKMNKAEAKQIKLTTLKGIVRSGQVWLIAAGRKKAPAVRMAVRNGLVNRLVIDTEIANYLLQNP